MMIATKWRLTIELAIVILTMAGRQAIAQEPRALVEPAERRSGLFTRHQPILPRLPVDKDRDVYYGTHWQDRNQKRGLFHPQNSWLDGGMYGLKLKADCVEAHNPYFIGAPGQSTIDCEDCRPPHKLSRYITSFVHPQKPVGMYYAGGSYVPIYDFDYFCPGPGPFPWNHYLKYPTGG
jgi:hypothetical protein